MRTPYALFSSLAGAAVARNRALFSRWDSAISSGRRTLRRSATHVCRPRILQREGVKICTIEITFSRSVSYTCRVWVSKEGCVVPRHLTVMSDSALWALNTDRRLPCLVLKPTVRLDTAARDVILLPTERGRCGGTGGRNNGLWQRRPEKAHTKQTLMRGLGLVAVSTVGESGETELW